MSEPAPAAAPAAAAVVRGTIRFEDLGEPVQRLLKSLKNDVSDEDMALLEYVSVKDMAKIYSEMTTDRHAEEIWVELREALRARREKAARREAELAGKQRALAEQQAAMEEQHRQQEAREAQERRDAEEARQQRREERRLQKEAEAAEAAELEAAAALEAAEEAAAAAEEEARKVRAEKKRKRREARARELQEEQEALRTEQARRVEKAARSNQKEDWAEYVKSHPLEFDKEAGGGGGAHDIAQEKLAHLLNSPPQRSEAVLSRTYTPKCPNCGTKYTQPPVNWECTQCLRHERKHVLVWQPDRDSDHCMVCKAAIGRWSRHHCRNCGRLTCSSCCETRALIPALGFKEPVKVCNDCAGVPPQPRVV